MRNRATSTYIPASCPILSPYRGAFASHLLRQRLRIGATSEGHWPFHLAASATTNPGISLTNPYKAISFFSPASRPILSPNPSSFVNHVVMNISYGWPTTL
jgi:hypothetical protein